jgi:hypothetical protein
MERAMGHFRIASLGKGACAAALACCVVLPAHAQTKISPEQFDRKLQDTRATIKKQQTTPPSQPSHATSNQLVVDICKKNPNLPQCKF